MRKTSFKYNPNVNVLSRKYYDGIFPADFPAELVYVADDYYGTIAASSKGQLTGTKVYMSDGNICEYTAMYYDKKGRLIQQRKTNFYAGNEDFYFRYNFVGELLETKHVVHSNDNFEGYTEKISNSIDHRGRLLSVSHQLNNDLPVVVATYQYDELGKLKEKTMFPNNPYIADRDVRYTYHIQGMLEKIESKLFEEVLIYGNKYPALRASVGSSANFLPSYNGNISAKITRAIAVADAGGGATIPMRDNYRYDKLDRLIADYHSGNGNQNFSVTGINYDLQGNILSLTRHGIEETQPGGGHAFDIVNQLAVVARGVESNETRSEVVSNDADLWASYGSQNYLPNGDFEDNLYDFNGNLLFDDMRETEFKYNYLNLATKITNPSDTMLIQYDALGNKVRQISGSDTMYFVGGSIYKNSQLYYLPLPEGYYRDGKYYAVIHDYLGSVRVVLRANDNKVHEVNHYDPFGIEYGLSYHPFGVQPFKHQGKERMNITGFSLHNHGARLADNVMGRWTTRDPLEEDYYWNGAYVYCGNNPVKYIDPNGMWEIIYNKNGSTTYKPGENDDINTLMSQYNLSQRQAERIMGLSDLSSNKTSNDGNGNTDNGNPPPDNTEQSFAEAASSATSTVSTILGTLGTCMQESTGSITITGSPVAIPPQIYTNGLLNGSLMLRDLSIKIANLGKGIGYVGFGFGVMSLYMDGRQYKKGDMSKFRFRYHLASFGVGLSVGIVGSMVMYGAEKITDVVIAPAHKSFWQWGESFKNPINWGQMYGY